MFVQADGISGQALPCTQVFGAVPMKVLCAGAHSLKRELNPTSINEHLPKAHLLIKHYQQVLTVA
jgi:hypothetical protein